MKAVEDAAELAKPAGAVSRQVAVFAAASPNTVRALLRGRPTYHLYEVRIPDKVASTGPLDQAHFSAGLTGPAIAAAANAYWNGQRKTRLIEVLAEELEVVRVSPLNFVTYVAELPSILDLMPSVLQAMQPPP